MRSNRSGSNFERTSVISAPWNNEDSETSDKVEEDKMVTFRQLDEMNQDARLRQKNELMSLQKIADS